MKDALEEMVAQVLDGTELELKVDALRFEEDLETGRASVRCEVHHAQTGEKKVISGTGVGIVDAFFGGLAGLYSEDFPSLTTIRFSDFSATADFDTGRHNSRADSAATVTLVVANASGREFRFEDTTPSISRSSINVVLAAVEFFINSERAFKAVYRALQHAKEQNRADSVALYTSQLSTLVEATSYSEVIEQLEEDS